MKRYEAYKAVQPLWNMTFPKHWEVFPLYSIAKEKSICNCTELELLSVYLDAGVVPFSKRTEKRTNATSKDLSKYQRVDPGDFVLNNQQAWRGSVGVSKHTGITSPAYIVLSMNDQLTTEYANYLFRSAIMVDQYLVRSKGVGSIQRNLYWQELKCASVLVPPRDEQDQIVRYLDWQVSKINHLIHGYQKQINLLDERKRIGNNLNQIARHLNEWRSPYPSMAKELQDAASDLATLKFEVMKKVGDAVGNVQAYKL